MTPLLIAPLMELKMYNTVLQCKKVLLLIAPLMELKTSNAVNPTMVDRSF